MDCIFSCQYPYLLPVMDVDFVFEHNLVMFIHPFRFAGSLKDVIYGVWQHTYGTISRSIINNVFNNQLMEILFNSNFDCMFCEWQKPRLEDLLATLFFLTDFLVVKENQLHLHCSTWLYSIYLRTVNNFNLVTECSARTSC